MSSSVVVEEEVVLDSSVSSSTLTLSASTLSDDDELSAAVVPFTVTVAFYDKHIDYKNMYVCMYVMLYLLGSRGRGLGLLGQSLVEDAHLLQLQRNVDTFIVRVFEGRLQRLRHTYTW